MVECSRFQKATLYAILRGTEAKLVFATRPWDNLNAMKFPVVFSEFGGDPPAGGSNDGGLFMRF